MSELKLPRLLAAAKEFNIGQDTLVEFLANKGFNRDDLKPTAKLSEQMYRSLQQEFQSDKVAKNKADQIEIPKGAGGGERKKKEEEDYVFKKEEIKVEKQPEPVPVVEVQAPPPPPPVIIEQAAVIVEPQQPATPEIVKIDAPELEGPKTLGKI